MPASSRTWITRCGQSRAAASAQGQPDAGGFGTLGGGAGAAGGAGTGRGGVWHADIQGSQAGQRKASLHASILESLFLIPIRN